MSARPLSAPPEHGLSREADAPPANLDLVEIALRARKATLCLTSALSLHDLTDELPTQIGAPSAEPSPLQALRLLS